MLATPSTKPIKANTRTGCLDGCRCWCEKSHHLDFHSLVWISFQHELSHVESAFLATGLTAVHLHS